MLSVRASRILIRDRESGDVWLALLDGEGFVHPIGHIPAGVEALAVLQDHIYPDLIAQASDSGASIFGFSVPGSQVRARYDRPRQETALRIARVTVTDLDDDAACADPFVFLIADDFYALFADDTDGDDASIVLLAEGDLADFEARIYDDGCPVRIGNRICTPREYAAMAGHLAEYDAKHGVPSLD